MSEIRIEKDSLGEVEVPSSAYYGAQTERARRNFPVSGLTFPRRFIAAMGLIKSEAATANEAMGIVDGELAAAIRQAADEVMAGEHDAHFPLDIFQTGSGTSTNMNANEVIANRAIELLGGEMGSKKPVHPNDHVNAGQSSNDIDPDSHPRLGLQRRLPKTSSRPSNTWRSGARNPGNGARRCRQDRPHTSAGRGAGAARAGVLGLRPADSQRSGAARAAVKPRLAELALGGTAVGTGLNAPAGFRRRVIALVWPSAPATRSCRRAQQVRGAGAKDAAVEASGARSRQSPCR